MAKKIIVETGDGSPIHPIRPEHIDTDNHFFEAFGHYETEVSARVIVEFCKEKNGGWRFFTLAAIKDFCRKLPIPQEGFAFNKLISEGFIVERSGGYIFTHEFICRCFMSSPPQYLIGFCPPVPRMALHAEGEQA